LTPSDGPVICSCQESLMWKGVSALHVSTGPTVQMLSWTANGHSHARSRDILRLYRIRSLLMIALLSHAPSI